MYREEVINLKIAGENIQLIQVTNIDEAFDALIQGGKSDEEQIDERIPYWMELWPSAIAMAEFISENPALFENKNAIELGSGLALPSIIAARYCEQVLVTDYFDDALNFAKRNMVLNGVENVNFQMLDWREIPETFFKYDIVLASDLAYEKRFFDALPLCFKQVMKKDGITVLTEPGRMFAQAFIMQLHDQFNVEKFQKKIEWRDGIFNVGIYVLRN